MLLLAFTNPLKLEYLSWPAAAGLFAALAAPIVFLGMRSLSGLGPIRKWVAIGIRLAVLLLFVLIIGGARWQRFNKVLELMVLRDISESTAQVRNYPGKTLQTSMDDWLHSIGDDANKTKTLKQAEDRIGQISFHSVPLIDAMPNSTLRLDAHPIRENGSGTDISAAIQLALATLSKDAMSRMLLISDGNETMGDMEAAANAAVAQGIQIYVAPLSYDVHNEILLERVIAPALKRENEPFSIDVILRSTNEQPVTGNLTVLHGGEAMDLDPYTPGKQTTRHVTLALGLNKQRVQVPALEGSGAIHEFHAAFEPDVPTTGQSSPDAPHTDTLLANNTGDAFTFVKGKGQVLYVDATEAGGDVLANALSSEGITLQRINVDQFPAGLVELQNYDAVVLANVPRGAGGLTVEQEKLLSTYVHDTGGGLVMIGGAQSFGAGGWIGSELEKVLPVNMDIPAQRQIPKGALVLAMHSCEMPDGNYWGEQCALKAIETLSAQDEIGVISYDWGAGGSNWDFPLAQKGDGTKVKAAVKNMKLGDMPSFDDMLNVALNGKGNNKGLAASDAKQKHVIVISDGDPGAPQQAIYDQFKKAKVSVSTVTVYPHNGDPDGLPPQMKQMATQLKGHAYGPINANPNQLPQIFIKEAQIVRRSLIKEDVNGIGVKENLSSSEMMKGLSGSEIPPLLGMVLTSRKPDPQVEMPLVAGKENDPVLAHWQTGLGKSAVFTGDATAKWGPHWIGSSIYSKFWAQVIRGVARPPISNDFDVQTTVEGQTGKVVVEALNKDDAFLNFLSVTGIVVSPNGEKKTPVRLTQTGPGRYEATFDAKDPGPYVVVLNHRGTKGDEGRLPPAGVVVNASPELRDLRSNESALTALALKTRGHVLKPFDMASIDLFTRDGLKVTQSPLPIWDILIPILLGLIIVDVAIRRIAWDWQATKRLALSAANQVRAFTMTTRKVESAGTLDALKRVRDEVAETKFRTDDTSAVPASAGTASSAPRPDPRAKFQAQGVEGDITQVVGGATDKAIPPPPKKIEPKGAPGAAGGHTSSLLEAKRRAQQQIREKEKGDSSA